MSLAGIFAIGMQPLGQHVIARYVSMVRNNSEELHKVLSNIWIVLAIVFSASLLVAVAILILMGKFNIGILVIFFGTSIFYIYWGLARAYLASIRLSAADVGNNLVQVILILWLIGALGMRSTTLAMLIQGLSCLVPLIILQYFWPLNITFKKELVNRQTTKDVFKFSMPIWLSHSGYLLYSSVAVLFLERLTDNTTVGLFSLAVTLSVLFVFLPTGFSTFLMPRVAEVPNKHHKGLLLNALGVVMLTTVPLLLVYSVAVPWLVEKLFGPEYLAIPELFILMAIVMTLNGVHRIITSLFVGSGRALTETKSRFVVVLVTVVGCWLLIPSYGALGAVWAMMLGILSGLGLYMIYLWDYFHRKSELS
jgi:O-antigen/teichoic acid export membrane protein